MSGSETSGIFGDFGNMGVGFSDKVLLTVSMAGFCFLGFTVYNIIVLKLKTREEIEKEEEQSTADYEERLVQADVASLSRAERRARARAIMKQQRRVQPRNNPNNNNEQQPDGDDAAPGDGQEQQQQEQPQQQIVAVHDDAADNNNSDDEDAEQKRKQLSKKQRQKMAKAAEKQARLALQDERRHKQKQVEEQARKERLEREKRQAQAAQEQKRQERMDRDQAERQRLVEWNTFLVHHDENDTNSTTTTFSVDEWIHEMQQQRTVSLDQLATRFDVPTDRVESRIRQLLREGRVQGIVTTGHRDTPKSTAADDDETDNNNKQFVYLSDDELDQMLQQIQAKGVVSHSDVAAIGNAVVAATVVHG